MKIESSGIAIEHAEAHAQALAIVLEETVSTKQETQDVVFRLSNDINTLRKDMDMKFAQVDIKFADLKIEISTIKAELIKWGLGISFAQAAFILSALKFF